jgi:hypothetical protein
MNSVLNKTHSLHTAAGERRSVQRGTRVPRKNAWRVLRFSDASRSGEDTY